MVGTGPGTGVEINSLPAILLSVRAGVLEPVLTGVDCICIGTGIGFSIFSIFSTFSIFSIAFSILFSILFSVTVVLTGGFGCFLSPAANKSILLLDELFIFGFSGVLGPSVADNLKKIKNKKVGINIEK